MWLSPRHTPAQGSGTFLAGLLETGQVSPVFMADSCCICTARQQLVAFLRLGTAKQQPWSSQPQLCLEISEKNASLWKWFGLWFKGTANHRKGKQHSTDKMVMSLPFPGELLLHIFFHAVTQRHFEPYIQVDIWLEAVAFC